MLADIAEGSLPNRAVNQISLDGAASGGQLINDREIQIAIDDHGKGARNGSGGHHQHMGIKPLLPQGGALVHPEAVLLVGDDQPQPGKGGIGSKQRMGADA